MIPSSTIVLTPCQSSKGLTWAAAPAVPTASLILPFLSLSHTAMTITTTCYIDHSHQIPRKLGRQPTNDRDCPARRYPTTVATLSRRSKDIIERCFEATVDGGAAHPALLSRLHDFGFRGCTSVEQSIIGGCAHLLNFGGSDTMSAAYYAQVPPPGRPTCAVLVELGARFLVRCCMKFDLNT
jgi:hypothetical protein